MNDYCGTGRGWKAHRDANEPPCKFCRRAVEAPTPAPAPRTPVKPKGDRKPGDKRGNPPTAPCGSDRAHRRHRAKGEDCIVCREAAAARNRARYLKERAAA